MTTVAKLNAEKLKELLLDKVGDKPAYEILGLDKIIEKSKSNLDVILSKCANIGSPSLLVAHALGYVDSPVVTNMAGQELVNYGVKLPAGISQVRSASFAAFVHVVYVMITSGIYTHRREIAGSGFNAMAMSSGGRSPADRVTGPVASFPRIDFERIDYGLTVTGTVCYKNTLRCTNRNDRGSIFPETPTDPAALLNSLRPGLHATFDETARNGAQNFVYSDWEELETVEVIRLINAVLHTSARTSRNLGSPTIAEAVAALSARQR